VIGFDTARLTDDEGGALTAEVKCQNQFLSIQPG
jgi:hypothetical protein